MTIAKDPNQAPRGEPEKAPEHAPFFSRRQPARPSERFALFITNAVGTTAFFLLVFGWTAAWLLWNSLGPRHLRFDPFPGFVLWLFLSNMIQLMLMPLIMIGQNIQARAADRRGEADLAVNRSAEEQVKEIRAQLDRMEKLLMGRGGAADGGERGETVAAAESDAAREGAASEAE